MTSLLAKEPRSLFDRGRVDALGRFGASGVGDAESTDYSAVLEQRHSARGRGHVLKRTIRIGGVPFGVDSLLEHFGRTAPESGGFRFLDGEVGSVGEHTVDRLEINENAGIVDDRKGTGTRGSRRASRLPGCGDQLSGDF